jgi:hypothetical protein
MKWEGQKKGKKKNTTKDHSSARTAVHIHIHNLLLLMSARLLKFKPSSQP